ncbi:MAG: glycosyltransferase family 4 protein, partial [Verrucomicrobiota bacterium]
MKILVFLNGLGLGGTEKAALIWAQGLQKRGHSLHVLALDDGPRRQNFEALHIEVTLHHGNAHSLREFLLTLKPDVIHAHCPGFPHSGDILGIALEGIPKIPIIQTNVFGRLDNPRENQWTDFRLFISTTSAIQATLAYDASFPQNFFRYQSVCPYPLPPETPLPESQIQEFRKSIGVASDEVLWGRIARAEIHKWSLLSIVAFRLARKKNPKIKLLLREPPSGLAHSLQNAPDREAFIILKESDDPNLLKLTFSALDGILHATLFGESYGYTLAEGMNLGKPAITNSTPWGDQAQLELVQHGQTGLHASIPETMRDAILDLSQNHAKRMALGKAAQEWIQLISSPEQSINRLESFFLAALHHQENPFIE